MNEKFLSVTEAANYLKVSRAHIYQMIFKKKLSYYKPGGKKVYFDVGDLEKYITKNRISSNDEIDEMSIKHIQRKK